MHYLFDLWFLSLLRWHLVHHLFSGLFNCYVGISRTICSRVCLTVTLVSRALFVFWFVWLLRRHLPHYLYPGLYVYYVGIWCTYFFFLVCLTVTLVSRALCFFWFVWLLRWYLGHYFFSGFSNCYVGILRSVCFLVCSTVTLVSRALFFFWFVWLLRWYLVHYLFSGFFFGFFLHNMILTLTTWRFLSRDCLRTLRYTTYSTLKIQLIFMLRTLFYVYYVQCDNAHIFRSTSFTHKKRETLLAALYKNY